VASALAASDLLKMKLVLFTLVLTVFSSVANQRLAITSAGGQSSAPNSEMLVPNAFKQIDFKNFSYPYKFSFGKRVKVALKNGEYEYDFTDERGWFNLSNVYFVDLTQDKRPEAVVMLWHVSCGVSCDGGSALFYVYSLQRHTLKSIWQYETGSLAYGCGLKSFSVNGKEISVELFGRCANGKDQSSGLGKFQVKDITRLTFESNFSKIVARKRTIIPTPQRSVLNYEPLINIQE
jgi:hypothetical protein